MHLLGVSLCISDEDRQGKPTGREVACIRLAFRFADGDKGHQQRTARDLNCEQEVSSLVTVQFHTENSTDLSTHAYRDA